MAQVGYYDPRESWTGLVLFSSVIRITFADAMGRRTTEFSSGVK